MKWEDYEPIPTGEYPVEITEASLGTSAFLDDAGKPKEQVTWRMIISSGDYEGQKLITWTSASPSLKGNLAKYAKACGFDVQVDQEFDIRDLAGCKAVAVVIVKVKDDGTEYNKVECLKPLKQGTGAVNKDGKVQWTCPGCNSMWMLTRSQIAKSTETSGLCRECFKAKEAEDTTAEDEDPFSKNPIPVES